MAKEILVPLKRRDRVDDILPYLKQVAREGMKVVFLMPFPLGRELDWRSCWIATESSRKALSEARKILDRTSWHAQKGLAEERIFSARAALAKRGVDVGVVLYTGSLRRLLSDHAANRDVRFIMVRAGIFSPMARLLGGVVRLLGFSRQPTSTPVLLLYTKTELSERKERSVVNEIA